MKPSSRPAAAVRSMMSAPSSAVLLLALVLSLLLRAGPVVSSAADGSDAEELHGSVVARRGGPRGRRTEQGSPSTRARRGGGGGRRRAPGRGGEALPIEEGGSGSGEKVAQRAVGRDLSSISLEPTFEPSSEAEPPSAHYSYDSASASAGGERGSGESAQQGPSSAWQNANVDMDELRIGGGSRATTGEHPYFVKGFGCGGVLLWYDVFLTAAHCYDNFGGKRVTVGGGSASGGDRRSQRRRRYKRVVHPDYDDRTNRYDFMIVKIQPISGSTLRSSWLKNKLVINGDGAKPFPNQMLSVMGFGAVSDTGRSSVEKLRVADVPEYDGCEDVYGSSYDPASMLCAGYEDDGMGDACHGDSGGPLVTRDGTRLVGIVSWGTGCSRGGRPGVYGRVSAIKPWIREQICWLSSRPPRYCSRL